MPTNTYQSADEYPLTPLEYLREEIGYSPFLFWGLSNDKVLDLTGSQCNQSIREYAWQAQDQIGRTAMRQALLEAELDLRDKILYYSVAPHYTKANVVYLQQNLRTENNLYNISQWGAGDPFGRWTSVMLPEGYVQAVGIEKLTSVALASAVTLSDEDGDSLYDTFTLTVSTTETNPLNLAVYFSSAERLYGQSVSEQWRIQPVQVSINAGTATIIGRAWTIVRPILYQGVNRNPLDPDIVGNYAPTLDVYTRTTYAGGTDITNAQAKFIWNTYPLPQWWGICSSQALGGSYSTDPAAEGYAVARCGILDAKTGFVLPGQATYNTSTQLWVENYPLWNWRPDRVEVRYLAGYPLDENGQVNKQMRDMVTRLALANMPERICACDVANKVLHYWQWDMSRVANGVEQYATTRKQLNAPFGTKRGQIDAFRRAERLALHRAVQQ